MCLIRKEREFMFQIEMRFIVSDKAKMPYNIFLDITVHKTVWPIQFNCGNKKAI